MVCKYSHMEEIAMLSDWLPPETNDVDQLHEEFPSYGFNSIRPHAEAIPPIPTALGALDAAKRAEFWAALALIHTRGLGARRCKRLLETFGSAFAAIQHHEDWSRAGVNEACSRSLASGNWRKTARTEWNAARTLRGSILLWTDPRYPARLKEIPDAPVRLYCQGDMSLLENPCIGIVGTRNCSETGIRSAAAFATALAASGLTVVSGLALGIDRQAHLAAVDLPGSTIAVLGAGLDVNYPSSNADLRRKIAKSGLLLSEYAPGTQPEARFFPVRNRIISGLSLGVLVVEAAIRSGSLITARLAVEQNRSVYAIAGGIGDKFAAGCQELIRQGAQPVFSSTDILSDLEPQLRTSARRNPISFEAGLQPRSEKPVHPPQTKQQSQPCDTEKNEISRRILELLGQGEARHVDDCCQILGLKAEEASPVLVMMEVRGLVRRLPDMRYTLV